MKPLRHKLATILVTLPLALALILSGCELAPVSEGEQIANVETILAGTPSATATPTITATPTSTATSTFTPGPSPTLTATSTPTVTPLPPTPTPNPALTGFSFCNQVSAGASGRFSAQLTALDASGSPAFEQLTLSFEPGSDSAPVQAGASCLSNNDALALNALLKTSNPYLLRVELPGWLHDDRFTASTLPQTLTFTNTRTIQSAYLLPSSDAVAGASLFISLSEALPYRLTLQRNPTRLTIAVARTSPLVVGSDMLQIPTGGGHPQLSAPIFYLYDGDIWRLDDAEGIPVNLTESPDSEIALALSPDRKTLAFCRAAPGFDPADAGLAVPSALWTMPAAGGSAKPLAQVGVSCADPAFSLDGKTLAFAVAETSAVPAQWSIFTLPTAGGTAKPIQTTGDAWSRYAPQWLADGVLIYAAEAEDGRNTLFLRSPGGEVLDVGAPLMVADGTAARYRGFGRPLASRDGSQVAVEALRSDSAGSDLLILAADGSLVDTIGLQTLVPPPATPTATAGPTATRTAKPTATTDPSVTPEDTKTPTHTPTNTATATAAGTSTATATPTLTPQPEPPYEPEYSGPYWNRPMAWDAEGNLLYLSTLCASSLVQDYQVYRWQGLKRYELLGTGLSLAGYGEAAFVDTGMVYVAVNHPQPGLRGPLADAPRSKATLWFWDLASGARGPILELERNVTALP